MGDGWLSSDERWNGETPFVWGTAPRSTLNLPLVEARPLRMALTGRPLPRDLLRTGAPVPRQAVTVLVNGRSVDTVRLDDGFQTYHVDVPGDVVRAGRNVIEFQYLFGPRADGLLASAAGDRIDRVVAWDTLEFDHVVSLDAPRVTEAADAAEGLRLPFNTGWSISRSRRMRRWCWARFAPGESPLRARGWRSASVPTKTPTRRTSRSHRAGGASPMPYGCRSRCPINRSAYRSWHGLTAKVRSPVG